MCRSLKASKAGYYAWRDRAASEHTKDDESLLTQSALSTASALRPMAVRVSMRSCGARTYEWAESA
jgi:hypothetical protein